MFRHFLLICLFAAAFQINAFAIETLETHYTPRRETADLAQYSPSEMKRIRRAIVAFQTELKRIGYYKGPIDGLYGRGTNAAWVRFAREHGLSTKRLGNYEYSILKSVADDMMNHNIAPKRQTQPEMFNNGVSGQAITSSMVATLSANILKEEQTLSLKKYLERNCKVNKNIASKIKKQHELLLSILQRRLKCESNVAYANREIEKLPKSPTAINISVRSVEQMKYVGGGLFPPKKCYVFSGDFGKGSIEHFINVVQLHTIDHIAISHICPQFSGGNVFEAINFIKRHVQGDFVSNREYWTNYSYGMIVLPRKTCGDICSLIFLSGYRGVEGEGAFRLMSRTSKISYKAFKPALESENLSGQSLEQALQITIKVNGELQKLSEQPFSAHADTYVQTSDKFVIPKTLLAIISKLGSDTYFMPTTVDKSVNRWNSRNKFRVLIYD